MKLVQFIAVIVTALSLVPSGAHFFELWNKIGLPQEQYFVVQQIYRGWALFGALLLTTLAADLALAFMVRDQRASFWLALAAAACLACTLLIFFTWTYPANQATQNWTVAPADWHDLRRRWEYSHAASAVVVFLGLCCVTLSALLARD
jgi:hypothetical protein